MDELTNIASIELTRTAEKSVLNVLMPVWTTIEDDCSIRVDMPMFEMSIFVSEDAEIEAAVGEAVHAFFWAAEKHGEGFGKELEKIGWLATTQQSKRKAFSIKPHKNDVIFNGMMKTGHSQLVSMSV